MDVDIQTTPFTVAGVGDMSGDVFGNGMLCSHATKLVAAFDHRDIFIDPNPDTEKSYAERKRMFALPRSSWEDYDKSLISEGGGVYARSSKSIPVSAQVRAALAIEGDGRECVDHAIRTRVAAERGLDPEDAEDHFGRHAVLVFGALQKFLVFVPVASAGGDASRRQELRAIRRIGAGRRGRRARRGADQADHAGLVLGLSEHALDLGAVHAMLVTHRIDERTHVVASQVVLGVGKRRPQAGEGHCQGAGKT
jgi:hypothetical protein